jgi:hypothetical protein
LSPRTPPSIAKLKSKILYGENEGIFAKVPNNVLANLRHPGSENALLWNLIYPLAQPTISMKSLLEVSPQWGTFHLELGDDSLKPYFWGYSISGERLPGLDEVLERIDGAGPKTEVDLFLLGGAHLVVVEAKHLSGLGRCSRFSNLRCPEIHPEGVEAMEPCRYWEEGLPEFQRLLNLGDRPSQGDPSPPCNRHYQLARTVMVGDTLAEERQLEFSLWMFVSRKKWRSIEKTWLDFAGRIRSDKLWRRMRVIAWEEIHELDWRDRLNC